MKTKANVHLLPTNEESDFVIRSTDNKLVCHTKSIHWHGDSYHFYITLPQSNLEISKIKKGNYWLYNCPINGIDYGDNNNPIVKNVLPNATNWFDKLHDIKNYEKIIATTDTSLILYKGETLARASGFSLKTDDILLPKISQQFIDHFIDEYNKGNVIKQIEIELIGFGYKVDMKEVDGSGVCWKEVLQLNVNQQNEISIVMNNNSPLDTFDPEDFSDDDSDPKEQRVDFEMLKVFLINLTDFGNINESLKKMRWYNPQIENLKLFFKLLSTKPTFANIAYKELNKLNK